MSIFTAMGASNAAAMETPWSVSDDAPLITSSHLGQKGREAIVSNEVSTFNPFVVVIKGFQHYISPVDGERCNMYPTCSSYGLHAFRKHGTFKGIVLTADRLLHEYDEPLFAPRIIKYGKLRYYDPVKYNDFWWHK